MYLWSAVISFGATAWAFLSFQGAARQPVRRSSWWPSLVTMNIPRLRRGEGTFTGLRRGVRR